MARAKIMIADTRAGAMSTARSILLRADYEVITVSGAADAVRVARGEQPDVVVIAAELADPNTLRELSRVTRPQLPVIVTVLFGAPAARPVDDLEGVVIVATIHKPIDDAALLAAVERAKPDPDEDPTIDALDAEVVESAVRHGLIDETVDEADVSDRARWLADRIGSQIPGLTRDPLHRHALTRACALALEAEAEKERTPLPSTGEIALEGRVGLVAVEQVFHLAENMPGAVSVCFDRGDQQIELFFRERHLVFARGLGLSPGFTLGRFLVDGGAIAADDLENFIREQASPFRRLGEQLVHFGLVEPSTLVRALEDQVQALSWEAMRWDDALFTVLRAVIFPEQATSSGVTLPVPFVLLEGLRRLDEWKKIVRDIGGMSAVMVRMASVDTAALETLSPAERLLLIHVDGERNVEDVARSAQRPAFEVCQVLAELRGRRMVTLA